MIGCLFGHWLRCTPYVVQRRLFFSSRMAIFITHQTNRFDQFFEHLFGMLHDYSMIWTCARYFQTTPYSSFWMRVAWLWKRSARCNRSGASFRAKAVTKSLLTHFLANFLNFTFFVGRPGSGEDSTRRAPSVRKTHTNTTEQNWKE